jgi:hypothetical protein
MESKLTVLLLLLLLSTAAATSMQGIAVLLTGNPAPSDTETPHLPKAPQNRCAAAHLAALCCA